MPISDESFGWEHQVYLKLMNTLRQRRFDIVHNNSLHYLPIAMAPTLPMPMLTTLHTPPFWELEGSMRLSDTQRHRVVAVSDVIRRAWNPIVPVECVIANGIDLDLFSFRASPDVEPYVIWYGRIVPEKGLHLAIEAARRAGLSLRFAGPISNELYYREKIVPLMADDARYLGHLAHVQLAAAIAGARAFLCTPVWEEPYGLVVAEALACGTPVAAFARGAVPELLDAGCGVLAASNDVEGLAAAALSAQQLDRFACRHRAQQIGDARLMMSRYESFYEDTIRRHAEATHPGARASKVASVEPTNAALIDLYTRKIPTMICPLPIDETVSCPR